MIQLPKTPKLCNVYTLGHMGICLKWHGDAGFLVNLTLWCLLTIIVKSFVDVLNSLGPSDAFICVSKLNIIGSDDGLSPIRRQAIIWTTAGILLIRPLRTNFSEIFIEVYTFSFKKMHSKMSSGKWRPFCLGLNVLRQYSNHPLYPYWRWTSFTWLSDNFQK